MSLPHENVTYKGCLLAPSISDKYINRQRVSRTLKFEVPRGTRMGRVAILDRLLAECSDLKQEQIIAIYQDRQPYYWYVEFANEVVCSHVSTSIIRTSHGDILKSYRAGVQRVYMRVHWLPTYVDNDFLFEFFADFGEVISVDDDNDTYDAGVRKMNGMRTVVIEGTSGLLYRLPHMVQFEDDMRMLITCQGRKPLCLRCGEIGHVRGSCSPSSYADITKKRSNYDGPGLPAGKPAQPPTSSNVQSVTNVPSSETFPPVSVASSSSSPPPTSSPSVSAGASASGMSATAPTTSPSDVTSVSIESSVLTSQPGTTTAPPVTPEPYTSEVPNVTLVQTQPTVSPPVSFEIQIGTGGLKQSSAVPKNATVTTDALVRPIPTSKPSTSPSDIDTEDDLVTPAQRPKKRTHDSDGEQTQAKRVIQSGTGSESEENLKMLLDPEYKQQRDERRARAAAEASEEILDWAKSQPEGLVVDVPDQPSPVTEQMEENDYSTADEESDMSDVPLGDAPLGDPPDGEPPGESSDMDTFGID